MKLLLSSMLFASLCALSSWSVSSETLMVNQSPNTTVREGDTVNITCCWKTRRESQGFWPTWWKNEKEIKKNQSINGTERLYHSGNGPQCSILTLKNVTKEDSAKYICEVTVDIPILQTIFGEGTVIIVTSTDNVTEQHNGNQTEDSKSLPKSIYIPLAVVAPLLLITVISLCCLRRKQGQAARVIYETPHFDSETQEMDKHSENSSRGSSQWCQVPVYESFDYFEGVESKQSG